MPEQPWYGDDPDAFRVGPSRTQSGVVSGYVTDDWPRFSPQELRTLLRRTWAAALEQGDDATACDLFITDMVPARSWEQQQPLPGLRDDELPR